MRLSELHVLIQGDSKGLDKALDQAEKHTKETAFVMSDQMAKVTAKMAMVGAGLTTAITVPFLAAANQAAKMASDMAESASKTNQVFGASAKIIQNFGKTSADSLGITSKAAMDAASSYGLILQASGLVERESAGMSLSLTKLSADLASFFNVGINEAMTSLKAGLVGESEPLRRFGVLLSEAAVEAKAVAMGITDVGAKLTEGEKVQARYALILEQTRKAQGDFARTSEGLANQERITQAQFEEAATSLGAKVLPMKLQLVKAVSSMIKTFSELPEPVRNGMLGVVAIGAAAGPAALGLSAVTKAGLSVVAMSKSLAPALLTMAGNSGAMIGMSSSATLAAGALGYVKVALAALTGPVGIAIALVAGMAVAWNNNFLGIQDMVSKSFDNVDLRMEQFQGNLDRMLTAMSNQYQDFFAETTAKNTTFLGHILGMWKNDFQVRIDIVSHGFKGILDITTAAMGGMEMIMGQSFDSLSSSTQAAILRLNSIVRKWAGEIISTSLTVLKFFAGPMNLIPGIIGDQYRAMIAQAEGYAASLKIESGAYNLLAQSAQRWADTESEALRKAANARKKAKDQIDGLGSLSAPAISGSVSGRRPPPMSGNSFASNEIRPMNPFGDGLNVKEVTKQVEAIVTPTLEAFRRMRDGVYQSWREMNALNPIDLLKIQFPGVPEEEIRKIDLFTQKIAEWNRQKENAKSILREMLAGTEESILSPAQLKSIAIMANPVLAMVPKIKEMATAFTDERNKRFRDTMRDIALQVQLLGTNSTDAKLKIKLLSEGMSEAQAMAVVQAERQRSEMEKYQEMLQGIVSTATTAIQTSLEQLLSGRLPSALKAIRNMFNQIFAQIAQDFIQSQLNKVVLNALGGIGSRSSSGGGGGLLGGLGGVASIAGLVGASVSSGLGSWSGGASLAAFADGGYMRPGQLSIVGERGPEIMVSGRGGTVIPNEALGGQTINVSITVYANDAASFSKTKEQIASEVGAAISRASARGS
jgi:hypothetical protein